MTKPPSAQVRRRALWTGAVMCALLLSTGSTRADDDNGIKELVKSMSDYLAAQKSISFDMQSTLDVVTTDGQRLGIASSGAVELNRPDKIRAERKGGFADVEVVFDGKTLTILGKNLNAYTQIPLAGGIDELVAELRDKHGRPLPAADLLMGDSYKHIMADVTDVKYLGPGVILGQLCEHVALRADDVDLQLWIAEGEGGEGQKAQTADHGGPHHCFAGWRCEGSSSVSASLAGSTCCAPAGGVKVKFPVPASVLAFQFQMSTVYCGSPGTVRLVMV